MSEVFCRCGSVDEPADLDEVVGEDAVPAPGSGAGEAVHSCAIQPVVAFRAADASFAAGPPADHLAERSTVLDLAARRARSALAGQDDVADPGGFEVVLDRGFAVAAVRRDRPGGSPAAGLDPLNGGEKHRRVGRVA